MQWILSPISHLQWLPYATPYSVILLRWNNTVQLPSTINFWDIVTISKSCVFIKERSMLKYISITIRNTIMIIQIYSRQLLQMHHYVMWPTICKMTSNRAHVKSMTYCSLSMHKSIHSLDICHTIRLSILMIMFRSIFENACLFLKIYQKILRNKYGKTWHSVVLLVKFRYIAHQYCKKIFLLTH